MMAASAILLAFLGGCLTVWAWLRPRYVRTLRAARRRVIAAGARVAECDRKLAGFAAAAAAHEEERVERHKRLNEEHTRRLVEMVREEEHRQMLDRLGKVIGAEGPHGPG